MTRKPQRRCLWLTGCALLMSLQLGCSNKGGEGAACKKPEDCRHGFRCEDDKCIGGPEGACSYLLRCIPKLSSGDKETLFGERVNYYLETLRKSPDEDGCARRLALIARMGRKVVLNRACGPRVLK